MKKIISLVLALVMIMALGTTAFAQDVGTAATGKGTITIANAAKGETYTVYKLFDASLNAANDSIVYTGDIPSALEAYFELNASGNIVATAAAKDGTDMSEDLENALTEWVKTASSAATAVSDGTKLNFNGLDYGYYVVTTTQGEALISVDSTMPDVTVYDKNSTDITAAKTVEKASYSIGETVNYTATFGTVNFYGEGDEAKQVIKYTITDTLPEFLANVAIDSIKITSEEGVTVATITDKDFDAQGQVEIDWATEVAGTSNPTQWRNIYDNGVKIIVKYHGTLTSVANINTANTNTVKIQPTVVDDTGNPPPPDGQPWDDSWKASAKIYTYAAALKKTDGTNALAGAEFTIKGLTVTPGNAAGEYIVTKYDPESTTESETLVTNSDGKLYIVGLASDVKLVVTETKAPAGYNKMDGTTELKPQVMTTAIYTESGTIHYDADGNVVSEESEYETSETVVKNLTDLDANAVEVVNKKGVELPSTGGMGTTLFYVFGAIMVMGAAVLLVTKKRMAR